MRKILYTLIILFSSLTIMAQELDNTLFFLKHNPKMNTINPAVNPDAKLWIGFPGLSSFSFGYNNNSFALSDVLVKRGSDIKNVKIDINNLYNTMTDKTRINLNSNISLIAFGFRVGKSVISFEVNNKFTTTFGLGKELVGFFNKGSYAYRGKDVDLGKLHASGLAYNEIALGYSRLVDSISNFIVGAKVKVIMGIGGMDLSQSNMHLDVAGDGMSARVNADLNAKISGPVKFSGDPNDFEFDDMDFDDNGGASTFLGSNNMGFGIDLGAQYSIDEDWTIYASIVDLGYINWSNTHNVYMNADYLWKGIDFSDKINDSKVDAFEDLKDDLKEEFKLKRKKESYRQALPAKLYVGGEYKVNNWMTAGVLSRTLFFGGDIFSSLTFSGNFFTEKKLSGTVSYSIVNNSYANIGLGFTAKIIGLQLFMVTDNIIATNFTSTRTMNFRMGVNIVI
ncbi:hypothetical protein E0494_00675 [Marinilabiliaceae bacterium JC040]|nr:hypothetical protein [Marinilabiliaceae bacterium JC040]